MKFIPGKYYKTRDGRKARCDRFDYYPTQDTIVPYFEFPSGNICSIYLDGSFIGKLGEHPLDIVSEWREEDKEETSEERWERLQEKAYECWICKAPLSVDCHKACKEKVSQLIDKYNEDKEKTKDEGNLKKIYENINKYFSFYDGNKFIDPFCQCDDDTCIFPPCKSVCVCEPEYQCILCRIGLMEDNEEVNPRYCDYCNSKSKILVNGHMECEICQAREGCDDCGAIYRRRDGCLSCKSKEKPKNIEREWGYFNNWQRSGRLPQDEDLKIWMNAALKAHEEKLNELIDAVNELRDK